MLNQKQFRNPPAKCTPGYFWSMGAPLDAERIKEQLEDMCAHGAKSVCLHPMPPEFRIDCHSNMTPPYLTPAYHKAIQVAVEECHRLGMNYYLYDEGGWPSGSACGQVWKTNPNKFNRRHIVADDSPTGYHVQKEPVNPELHAPYPNLLEPGVTETFLKLTHEGYKKHFGKHFGSTVRIAFTDEPCFPSNQLPVPWNGNKGVLGWCDGFDKEFLRRKGYDIRPWIPKLLSSVSPNIDKLAEVRIDYCDVLSQLFVERYLVPLRDWCRKNKLLSGGHFGGEDEWFVMPSAGYGHILRSLRTLDVPGVDMIWRQLFPHRRLHPFPKLASAAAHQSGASMVLGELYAIYGAGITPNVMKYLLDYMLVCGVNTFVISHICFNDKEKNQNGGRPHFGPPDILWKYFGNWHSYVGRMSWLMQQGHPAVDTALYFDQRSMWIGGRPSEYAICRCLEATTRLVGRQCDFDYIDDDMILAAKVKSGRMVVGKTSYKNLVIPGECAFAEGVREKLDALREAGINVTTEDGIDDITPTIQLKRADSRLRVAKRDLGNGEAAYFVFNTADKPVEAQFTVEEKGTVAVADAEEGVFHPVTSRNGSWNWTFAPWESRYFIVGEVETVPFPAKTIAVKQELKNWKMQPLICYCAKEGKEGIHTLKGKPKVATLGDWRAVLGDDFSGDVLYTTTFRCDDPKSIALLNLGKVNYACEVRLNGKPLGQRIWTPYLFDVKGALVKGENKLEVVVTNTLGNSLSPDEVDELWAKKYPPRSPYEQHQRLFEKDTLESGLFGPVLLLGK